jgi:hypothetical protein
MSFKLEIETDNAAFQPLDYDGRHEIARILRDVIRDLQSTERDEHWLCDLNGNKVGSWKLADQ